MSCTSLHKPTNRWLTSFGADAKPGDEVTWSVGHPLNGGEFTTIRLGQVIAHDDRGEPLFDEHETEVLIGGSWSDTGASGRIWVTRSEIAAAKKSGDGSYPSRLTLHGLTFEKGGFGSWRLVAEQAA